MDRRAPVFGGRLLRTKKNRGVWQTPPNLKELLSSSLENDGRELHANCPPSASLRSLRVHLLTTIVCSMNVALSSLRSPQYSLREPLKLSEPLRWDCFGVRPFSNQGGCWITRYVVTPPGEPRRWFVAY